VSRGGRASAGGRAGGGGGIRFEARELLDLAVAWVALGVAFVVFFGGPGVIGSTALPELFALSMATAGVGFLLHELAHKVVATRFGQVAHFRADYSMLFLAVAGAFAGILFAAPGAVYHRGRITARENGLVALAGPVTNLLLAAIFAPLAFLASGFVADVGDFSLTINLLLAGFNMIPFGPLDGRTVFAWSKVVFVLAFVPSAALAALALFRFGFGI
jgi:Zn-dependent protease